MDPDTKYKPSWDRFSYSYTCVIILVLTFLVTLKRDLSLYIKLNTIGVAGIIILGIFILVTGFMGISQTEYTASLTKYEEQDPQGPYIAYVVLFGSQFGALMGNLGGGFYFHNLAIPVIAKNPNPKTNNRDLFIGYTLVFITYCAFGVVGYLGFLSERFEPYRKEDGGLQENALDMFPTDSIMANIVRFCVFLHIVTVNALLFSCQRAQILLLVTGKQEAANQCINVGLNMALMTPAFLLAIYYPEVGTLAGFCGAFATMLVIYMVPTLTWFKMKYDATKNPPSPIEENEEKLFQDLPSHDQIDERTRLNHTNTASISDNQNQKLTQRSSGLQVEEKTEQESEGSQEFLESDMEEFRRRIKPAKSMSMLLLGAAMCIGLAAYGIFAFSFVVINTFFH